MIIFNLLLITTIITYCLGISGFVESMKMKIWKFLYKNIPYTFWSIKPIDCPVCMTFWIGLFYIYIMDFTLLNLTIVCLYSLFQPVIQNVLVIFREILIKLTNKL